MCVQFHFLFVLYVCIIILVCAFVYCARAILVCVCSRVYGILACVYNCFAACVYFCACVQFLICVRVCVIYFWCVCDIVVCVPV